MPERISPENYFYPPAPQKMEIEISQIPSAMWILLGIALVAMAAITLYALKTVNEVKKGKE